MMFSLCGVEISPEHDEVWGASVDELLDAGITETDVIILRRLGWRESEDAIDAMTHFT